jgi:hypothetical protein
MRRRGNAGPQPAVSAVQDAAQEDAPEAERVVPEVEVVEPINEAVDPRTGQPWRYPNLHCLLYGEGAAGKSTFIAGYARRLWEDHGLPSLIMGFDPPGKMYPYYDLGVDSGPSVDPDVLAFYGNWGIPVTDVWDAQGNVVARIEHYAEPENVNLANAAGVQANPRSWANFNARLTHFGQEAPNWGLVALDSMTGLIYANMCLQRALKPMVAFERGTDTRQWYAMATDDVEGLLKSRLPWWATTVFVVCHVAGDKDKEEYAEGTLRGVSLVGRLNKNAVQCYEEMWRLKVIPNIHEPGTFERVLQTRSDTIFTATSLIAKAPNPCAPDYDTLWGPYRRRKLGLPEEAGAAPAPKPTVRRRR